MNHKIINPWLAISLILVAIWFFIYILNKKLRKEMLLVSIFTMPFGLTEPLFVPEYWTPPSLFNLAIKTGFDIESLIFSFTVGGIGAVLYELFFKVKHEKMTKKERHKKRHRFHFLALFSPVIIFIPLAFTSLNVIYSAIIAMFIGGIATIICRPDLKSKALVGGILFLVLYLLIFVLFNLMYPKAVFLYWNLSALSGILFLDIPLEELLFAFSFGMLWSSVYEHVFWYKVKKKNLNSNMY